MGDAAGVRSVPGPRRRAIPTARRASPRDRRVSFYHAGSGTGKRKEVGRVLGEFWAPVCLRPLRLAEITGGFQRAEAEIDGRGALTPAAFAAAIMKRGVDFGIAEFRRFLLLKTTSENTFESQLGTTIEVVSEENAVPSRAVRIVLALRDRLPRDVKKGKRWVYRGLQGPVDRALVELAEAGNRDELRGERGLALIDALFGALRRVDRNKQSRKENVRFELLPPAWLSVLVRDTSGFASHALQWRSPHCGSSAEESHCGDA